MSTPFAPEVLVVDDDPTVRDFLHRWLHHHGFRVRLAADGREAVDLYRTHREEIAVVLCDIHMPELDGLQTLAALRQENPHICCCLMSGNLGEFDVEDLHQRGAVRVFAKPIVLGMLVEQLGQLVEHVERERGSSHGPRDQAERRQWLRRRCTLPVALEAVEFNGTWWMGQTQDISESGLGLTVSRRYEPGVLVSVRIGLGSPLTLMGRVVRAVSTRTRAWLLGLSFPSIVDADELGALLEEADRLKADQRANTANNDFKAVREKLADRLLRDGRETDTRQRLDLNAVRERLKQLFKPSS